MSTAKPVPPHKQNRCLLNTGTNLLSAHSMKADAILFSAKSFSAAMLAYYIFLRIALSTPFQAIDAVYAYQLSGASLICCVYRFAATLIGSTATVTIIPKFMNSPIVSDVMLAGLIGLYVILALLRRATAPVAPKILPPGWFFSG